MRTKAHKAEPKKKSRRKILKLILAIATILIVAAFLLFPVFVSSEKGREIILAKINDSLDGQTDFATLSMGWFKGVTITDFNFNDNAGRGWIAVKQIATKPHYGSILTGSLAFGKTIIDEPRIKINLANSKAGKEAQLKISSDKKSKPIAFPIKKIDLVVNDGNLKVTGKEGKTVELSQINSSIDLRPPGQKTDFEINMAVVNKAKESNIRAKGWIRPARAKRGWSLKGTSGQLSVEVNDLELESLGPVFALMGKDIQASGKLNAQADVKIDDGSFEKLRVKAVLSDIRKFVAGKDVGIDEPVKIDAQISSDEKTVRIDKLNISSSFCRLKCQGTADAVSYNASADLGRLQDFASQFIDFGGYAIDGELTADGKASFGKNRIKMSGQSHIEKLVVTDSDKRTTPAISPDISFDIEADTDKNVLRIASAKATARAMYGPGDIEIRNSVVPLSGQAKEELGVEISADIDLKKLQPFAVIFTPLPKEMDIEGKLKSNVSVSRKKGSYRIATDATGIKNLKLSYPGRAPFEQKEVTLVCDAEVNPAVKSVNVRKLRIDSPQIKIRKGAFSQVSKAGKTKLKGAVDCEYDWSAVSTVTAPFLPKGLRIEGQRKDTIKFSSEYPAGRTDELLANLNTKSKVGFERAWYLGFNFGPTEVDVQIKNGLLEIAPFSTRVNNGRLNFAGKADFNRKPTLLRTVKPIHIVKDIQLNDETADKLLMYLNPIFANAFNVTGVANFQCRKLVIPLAGDSKNDIEVAGTIWIDRLQLQSSDLLAQILSLVGADINQYITIHPTKFVLRNGLLRYDDMQMDIGKYPLNFKGSIGLDKSLDMMVTLPYTTKGTTAEIGKEIEGERITLPLKGYLDKPELDLGKLLEGQLKQQLKDLLKEQLEKELKGKLEEQLKDTVLEGLEKLFE